MSAFCAACGTQLSQDSAFCSSCGAPTAAPGAPAAPSAAPAAASAAVGAAATQDQKNLAMLVWIGTIFFGFIPGLIVYLIKDDPYVKGQAKEALNWSITAIFGYLIGWILTFVLVGLFVILAIGIMNLVLGIMGAVACSKGRAFRTPMTIRLIK